MKRLVCVVSNSELNNVVNRELKLGLQNILREVDKLSRSYKMTREQHDAFDRLKTMIADTADAVSNMQGPLVEHN